MRGVAEIELNGMVLNVERHEAIKQMTQERRKTYEDRLRRELGWDNEEGALKNMNSPAQVIRVIGSDLKVKTTIMINEFVVNDYSSLSICSFHDPFIS